jgi:hypothetical protein
MYIPYPYPCTRASAKAKKIGDEWCEIWTRVGIDNSTVHIIIFTRSALRTAAARCFRRNR